MATKTYSIEMLSAETGIAARTLRSWIGHRVLPRPAGKTRAARYDENHVLRARVIRHLRERGDPLTVIRRIIAPLSTAQLTSLLPARSVVEAGGSAREQTLMESELAPAPVVANYPSVAWETVELMPGLLLMVKPDGPPAVKRTAGEIWRHYGLGARA